MGSFFAKNWNVRCLLGVIHFFTKHKSKTVLNSLVKIVKESNRKQNKFWVDQGMEFYNKRMQERLDNDNILVIAERFIKTLKAKIYKKNDSWW